jgi:hypothetical protein
VRGVLPLAAIAFLSANLMPAAVQALPCPLLLSRSCKGTSIFGPLFLDGLNILTARAVLVATGNPLLTV